MGKKNIGWFGNRIVYPIGAIYMCTHGLIECNLFSSWYMALLALSNYHSMYDNVPLVEQELLTLPDHMSSPPAISGVRVTRSLVLCVCFVNRCLSFCTFSFGHSSSIYGFWLPLWYLLTLNNNYIVCVFHLERLMVWLNKAYNYSTTPTSGDYIFERPKNK